MKQNIYSISYFSKVLFAFIPVIYVVISILINLISGKNFMQRVDPEYFHLFNGINIAIGNLAVEYIAHPGTTIQFIYAISAHIANIIIPGGNLVSKVLDNPEVFIHAANILMNLLTGISLYFLATSSFRYTKNFYLAIFLQLLPFADYHMILIAARIIPESVMIAPAILLVIMLVKYVNDEERGFKITHYILGFAIVGGLGMAGKLSYLPFLIPPVFILKDWKSRFKYVLYTIIATIVFAFPLIVNIEKSWQWFSSMLIHSGKWGSGGNTVINVSEFPKNILKLLNYDISLSYIMLLGFVQLVLFHLLKYFRIISYKSIFSSVIASLLVVYILAILLVAKHFSYHYFTPFLILKFIMIYFMIGFIIHTFKGYKVTKYISAATLILGFILVYLQISPLQNGVKDRIEKSNINNERYKQMEAYLNNENTIILSSHFSGSPFIQSAFVDAFLINGFLKSTFREELIERFPKTYFSFNWTDDFYYWDDFLTPKDFIDPDKSLLIFIGKGLEGDLDRSLKRIKKYFPDYKQKLEILVELKSPEEKLYKLSLLKEDIVSLKE
ncbi:MAG: hypothetical protein C0598_10175 [Marinilabiliales bacterium]|nr:MAG: hypothetical protein C0598_10175 [Marinilabiliales bacterium]